MIIMKVVKLYNTISNFALLFFFQEPILKIWLQIVVKAGAINFDALHQLLYLLFIYSRKQLMSWPVASSETAGSV